MQRFFSVIKQAFRKNIVILGLMSLLSLSGLFIFGQQSVLAASDKPLNNPSQKEETVDRAYTIRQGVGLQEEDRQEAYDAAANAITDPKGLDKIYEEDLKAYKETQPDTGLIEGAKELIKEVTGND
jgi:hypothetical protein